MNPDNLINRHLGNSKEQTQEMLNILNVSSLDELIVQVIPDDIRLAAKLDLPQAMTESAYLTHASALANKNKVYKSYIGLGYHPAKLPAVIQRNIFENPSWYTAYTPYQAEISQGRLEALVNYQTMLTELTGMELANASLLDEGTAAAEAMIMLYNARSRAQKKANANVFFVSEELLPQTIAILETRAEPLGIQLLFGNHETVVFDENIFGAIVQYPAKYGELYDYTEFINKAKEAAVKTVFAADLLSLTILKSPAELGADVAVGSTQRFGIPMGFGGPHAGYFATSEAYKRQIPGRIIGQTIDTDGNPALRMALQTREQHIKRDRATSNICTAQVLLAVMAGMYAVYYGADGLKRVANTIHINTVALANALAKLGFENENKQYFDTIRLNVKDANIIKERALAKEINFNYIDTATISISINEFTTKADLEDIVVVITGQKISLEQGENKIPTNLKRTSSFMEQEVFNSYHSESAMMRYIKYLERKDLSLTHSMISLGSCTMKLNAASELLPLSWSNWTNIHPFVPQDQAQGYLEMLKGLEDYLSTITGFAATSLQPNSGAQGEYAGLMVIRAYHKNNGEGHRNIALIPASAHGTNPASAVMAGMKVVVVKTDENGNIDLEDLTEKATKHADNLACFMVTYPSTHGVFESAIIKMNKIIHDFGGQVYMDGANMNAQVGLTNPATIGADVCHLNLHKTFAIPHGGGGPGVGPICVATHLVDYLPSNPVVSNGNKKAIKAISSAPYGSAYVSLISYGYIRMMGESGLTNATKQAILNANYLEVQLAKAGYKILYKGEAGRAAHEFIIDYSPFKANGVAVIDVAKRLMDYGFHAPTVSFPVHDTLMIEPTESEDKKELDRFINALVAIKNEIEAIDDKENNLLINAPHTEAMATADDWTFPYTRSQAVFPLDYIKGNKFWPSVRRVNDAYGDRNLVCTCNPISDYEE
jgi:glycine dehydrogenase